MVNPEYCRSAQKLLKYLNVGQRFIFLLLSSEWELKKKKTDTKNDFVSKLPAVYRTCFLFSFL